VIAGTNHIRIEPYRCCLEVYRKQTSFAEVVGPKVMNSCGDACGAEYSPRGGTFIVWAPDFLTLTHELMHVALDVLKRAEVDPTATNGEPCAYLYQQMMSDVLELPEWSGVVRKRDLG
jgi:hypothetical protein